MKRLCAAFAILGTVATSAALLWPPNGRAWENPVEAAAVPKTDEDKNGQERPLAKFMRAKLTASSQVLEGLCTEDFELIAEGARSLKHVSHAEQWRVSNDAIYRQHSGEFRTGVDNVLKAAQKRQIDSAALAWTRTTLNCIECHRWVKATLISQEGGN